MIDKQNFNMLVLDQATISAGICVVSVKDGKPKWTYCVKWAMNESDYEERMTQLYGKVKNLIQEHSIDILVLEDVPPIMKNFHSTSVLLKLLGVLQLAGKQEGVQTVLMNVRKWKSLANIKAKGRPAQKKESIILACERWQEFKTTIAKCDDVADCLNMSYAYLVDKGYIPKEKK